MCFETIFVIIIEANIRKTSYTHEQVCTVYLYKYRVYSVAYGWYTIDRLSLKTTISRCDSFKTFT